MMSIECKAVIVHFLILIPLDLDDRESYFFYTCWLSESFRVESLTATNDSTSIQPAAYKHTPSGALHPTIGSGYSILRLY